GLGGRGLRPLLLVPGDASPRAPVAGFAGANAAPLHHGCRAVHPVLCAAGGQQLHVAGADAAHPGLSLADGGPVPDPGTAVGTGRMVRDGLDAAPMAGREEVLRAWISRPE